MTHDDTTRPTPEHSTAQTFIDSREATIRAQAATIEAATKENSRLRKLCEGLIGVCLVHGSESIQSAAQATYGALCANERMRQMLACCGGIDATPGECE